MKIGELFVNLGVKTEGASRAVGDVNKGILEVKSSGLAAKAAIVGMIYGLHRLTDMASERANSIKNFFNLTGYSADKLQRWQYVARQAGESAESMQSSILGVQNAMTQLLYLGKAPEGTDILQRIVGFDVNKASDIDYVMGRLKEFAKVTKDNPGLRNYVLRSFGLSDQTISTLAQTEIELDKIKPSKVYNSNELNALSKMKVQWDNFFADFEMGLARLNIKHGSELIRDLSKISLAVLKLADAMVTLGEKLKVFKAFEWVANGITTTLNLISEAVDLSTGKKTKESLKKDKNSMLGFVMDSLLGVAPPALAVPQKNNPAIAPTTRRPNSVEGNTVNTTVNINGYSADDAQTISDHLKKELNNAMQQNSSLPGFY